MKEIKKVFTTGEAAKILGISLQTVIRLCDNKELNNFKVPGGSRHRRIPAEPLFAYARENNIPVDQALLPDLKGESGLGNSAASESAAKTIREKPVQVLVIDKEGGTASTTAIILSKRNCEVRRIEELFPAGAMAGRFLQDIILVSSAFAGNLGSILKTFPGEPLKILQETEDGYSQVPLIVALIDAAFERRRQKESREHDHPQLILCV